MFQKIYLCVAASFAVMTSQAKDLQSYLNEGLYKQAATEHAKGDSNKSKFTAAICELGSSLERFQQGMYTYGLEMQGNVGMEMGIGLPVPHNPEPKEIDYAKFRKLVVDLHKNLHSIEALVANVGEDDFYLPLDLTKARIDVNKDGKFTDDESSMALFMRMNNSRGINRSALEALGKFDGTVGFDKSDLLWLKGYIQVCLGMTDFVLAHDFSQPFDVIAPTVFQKTANAHPVMQINSDRWMEGVSNLIAMLHVSKMKVAEPERLKQSRIHFLNMIKDSRTMWKSILSETDDRKEWLAGPKQKSVTGIEMNDEMVKNWHLFLNEYEMVMEGKKLLPHWRFKKGGVNIKRAFEESKETDIVLWITGHAAQPYVEEGKVIDMATWNGINRAFGNDFLPFAFFIN